MPFDEEVSRFVRIAPRNFNAQSLFEQRCQDELFSVALFRR